MNKYKIIAHKCGSVEAKLVDNSLEALQASTDKAYIDGYELDIQITNDGELVVMHDSIIDRRFVWHYDFEALNRKYLAENLHPVRTLDEMLQEVPHDKEVLIEIKSVSSIFTPTRFKKVIETLTNIIKNHPTLNINVISFVVAAVEETKKLNGNIKTTLLTELKSFLYETKTLNSIYGNTSIDAISFERGFLNQSMARHILESGRDLGVFTIKEIKHFEKVKEVIGTELLDKYSERISLTTSIPTKLAKNMKRAL